MKKPDVPLNLSRIISIQQEIATSELSQAPMMELICVRTQEVTSSDGAVIELADGEEMVYAAASGTVAQHLNLRLKIGSSFSGLCVRTGQVLRCDDSELDTRVDREACRKVGARSMVCVPLVYREKNIGVLKVMSKVASFFSDHDIDVLQLMSGLLSTTFGRTLALEEKNQAIVSLRESEERFRKLLDAAYEAIAISEDGIIIDGSVEFCRLFGYTPEEVRGMHVLDFISPDSKEAARQFVQSGYEKPFELTGMRKDRSPFGIEVVAKTSMANGRRTRVTAIRDISARKNSEEALRASEMKFKSLLQSANDAVIAADDENRIIAWNRAAERIFGYSEAEALGQSLGMIIPERFREAHRQGLARVAGGVPSKLVGMTLELVSLRRTGEEFPIELSLSTWNQDGKMYFTSVIRDLSEKKKAEATLKSTTKTLQTLIRESPVGILVLGSDFKLKLWNPACERIFGWPAEEALGNFFPFVPPEKTDEARGIIDRILKTREPYFFEADRVRKDGARIRISTAAMPLVEEDGRAQGLMAVISDVTEQVQSRRELLQAKERAELSNAQLSKATQAKSEFLANMSHEIRTPINGVIGMASLLLDTNLSNEQREYSDSIRRSADTLLTLVNDILDFSKIEAGKVTFEAIDFDLEQVVDDIERTLSFNVRSKGLRLARSLAKDLPRSINGDPTRVRQVLLNLVGNAIKFTREGHVVIEISLVSRSQSGVVLKFAVVDSGIGISPEGLKRMFQTFSQVDSSTTRKFGGTGLGLSISKHLVEMMKGEIGVESEEGKGSTFWFKIPFGLGAEIVQQKTAPVALEPSGTRMRILVAEDNSVNQVIAVKMLEKMGHTAVAVANGLEAVEALRTGPYDMILMDCQMPEMDGYEATRVIRQERLGGDIPIIALTANAMAGDREKCLDAGMSDYLAKPMKPHELADAIERAKNLSGGNLVRGTAS